MRRLPHVTPATIDLRARVERALARPAEPRRKAEQRVILASIDCVEEKSREPILESLRQAAVEFRESVEAGLVLQVWQVWDWTWISLVAGDRSLARLLHSLPKDVLWIPEGTGMDWVHLACRTAGALVRSDEATAKENAGLLAEVAVPEDWNRAEVRNVIEILSALAQRRPVTGLLEERARILAEAYVRDETVAPITFVDWTGLGLARLARDREVDARPDHVYLPLELIDG